MKGDCLRQCLRPFPHHIAGIFDVAPGRSAVMLQKSCSVCAASLSYRPQWLAALALIGALLVAPGSRAESGLCATGSRCATPTVHSYKDPQPRLLEFGSAIQTSIDGPRRDELSSQEFLSFSGIGAIVCTVDGAQRMSTAFLVGAFDIAVTVAHTFEHDGAEIPAENCIYTSTDSLGQIRERIPVSYVKSQWASDADAADQAAKDFAVVRLAEPSRYAQRTMPLGKFSGKATSVLMVGLRKDLESDPLKSKSRGTVYERAADGIASGHLEGFVHDIDARGIAAGAPVIDEHSGVIIGIHTLRAQPTPAGLSTPRNTMITMNEWLEQTLRMEMQASAEQGAMSDE